MAKDTSLTFSLYGKDVSATSALKNVGNAAKETGGTFGRIRDIAAGVFSAHMIEKAGAELMKFGKESLTAFVDVGKEVAKTQRITGGSVEEASKLRFAFMESGLEIDKAQMSLKKFAQSVDGNSKAFKTMHINVKDAHGQQKTFNELLLETADKFQKMPNGIHKSALAVNLFGRTGLDMLKFLNKGKEGLVELEDEAQKYGLVLTKDNMAAVAANVKAHKELHAAMQGLQVQIGAHLTPVLTKVVTSFTTIFPILLRYVNPAFKALGEFLNPIVKIIEGFATHVLTLGKHFATSSSSMGKFHDIAKNLGIVVKVVGDFAKNTLIPALEAIWAFIAKYLAPTVLFLVDILSKTLVVAIKVVATALRWVIDGFRDVVNFFREVTKTFISGGKLLFNAIVSPYREAFNLIAKLWNNTLGKLSFKAPSWIPGIGGKGWSMPKIPMLAEGGIVDRPTLAMIGEAGPEAVVPLNRGLGHSVTVVVNVSGSVISENDLIKKVRDGIAQQMRRNGATTLALGI